MLLNNIGDNDCNCIRIMKINIKISFYWPGVYTTARISIYRKALDKLQNVTNKYDLVCGE